MTLLDWLRRLGILRYGYTAGVYHNARERPLTLQMPDVLNVEKDVIDFDKPAEAKLSHRPKGSHGEQQA